MKEDESFVEIEVWDGDEHYATAFGPRDYVVSEAKRYARSVHEHYGDDIRFVKVVRIPVTLEELTGEVYEG